MLDCFEKMNECHEEIILKMARGKEIFNKRDVIEALHISVNHAGYLLKKLVVSGDIELVHRGRYSKYRIKEIC
jgi:predicted transcriptional regulator of viral defense system